MSNVPFTVKLTAETRNDLEKVASAYGMRDTEYAKMILGRLSRLKPEFALDALSAIPKEFFRQPVGRPTTAAASARTHVSHAS